MLGHRTFREGWVSRILSSRLLSRFLSSGLLFSLFFVVVVLLQWRGNAFGSELGGTADEPAHYITGLMVHDYLAAGLPGPPMPYARNYYLHYPKVGLGHWPPLFYLVQAAWTLIFTASRTSVMLLMAAITALLATVMCESLRAEFSLMMGIGAGMLLISLPIIEEFSHFLMAEMLVALLVLLAVLAYGRYLDTGHWQPAAWFGLWFTLALLTKGTAIQLAFVPPLAVLFGRRWHLLGTFSFWLPAILVLGIAGPWYLWVPDAQHESVARFGGIQLHRARLITTPASWASMLGAVLLVAAAAGLLICCRRIFGPQTERSPIREGSTAGKWTAGLAILLGAYLVRLFVGAFEVRHLLVNLPTWMMFAAVCADWIFRRPWWRRRAAVPKILAVGLALVLFGLNVHASQPKRHSGFSEIARDLRSHPELKNSIFLVCSGADGEGMLISEVAEHESRPGHIVLRATKMLASMDWRGEDYRPYFHGERDMLQYLEDLPVGIVIIDDDGRRFPHGRLLYQAILAHPEKWQLLDRYPPRTDSNPDGGGIQVYRLIGHEGRPAGKIRINMRSGLYGNFEN